MARPSCVLDVACGTDGAIEISMPWRSSLSGEVEALATKCASLCGAPPPDFTAPELGKKRGAMKACPQCAKLIPNRCETAGLRRLRRAEALKKAKGEWGAAGVDGRRRGARRLRNTRPAEGGLRAPARPARRLRRARG